MIDKQGSIRQNKKRFPEPIVISDSTNIKKYFWKKGILGNMGGRKSVANFGRGGRQGKKF